MAEQVLFVEVGGRRFASFGQASAHIAKSLEKAIDDSRGPLTREMRRTLERVLTEMKRRHSADWNGRVVNASDNLQRRSGEGLAGIDRSRKVRRGSGDILAEGEIGAPFPMSVHEEGATVRAKSSKYLTIPLPAAMDSRGVSLRRRARDWDNTFVAQSSKGNLLIFRREGRQIVPLYLLKEEVTIRPRLGLGKAVFHQADLLEKNAADIVEAQFDKEV